jgi:membrane protease YdiL (CAAX protease family)
VIGITIEAAVVAAVTGTDLAAEDHSAVFTILTTLIQGLVFLAVAVGFASLTRRPRLWHFGLRSTPFWPAVGWAALGMLSFYVFSAVYAALAKPDVDQGVTQALGADQGTLGLIVAGVVVVVVAPISEEFFFRGFFFRSLRNRMPVLIAAALTGTLFGLIHWDGSSDGILIVPPLAFLGFVFCLVYDRTGSLFPSIALHAVNNVVAYAVQVDDGWLVSLPVGVLMLAACALAPRLIARGPAAAAPAPG